MTLHSFLIGMILSFLPLLACYCWEDHPDKDTGGSQERSITDFENSTGRDEFQGSFSQEDGSSSPSGRTYNEPSGAWPSDPD